MRFLILSVFFFLAGCVTQPRPAEDETKPKERHPSYWDTATLEEIGNDTAKKPVIRLRSVNEATIETDAATPEPATGTTLPVVESESTTESEETYETVSVELEAPFDEIVHLENMEKMLEEILRAHAELNRRLAAIEEDLKSKRLSKEIVDLLKLHLNPDRPTHTPFEKQGGDGGDTGDGGTGGDGR